MIIQTPTPWILYSPPNGNHPQSLPDFWVDKNGEERTDLPTLSEEELELLGWKKIIMPSSIDYYTNNFEWNFETRQFDAIEISEDEKRRRVNYQSFWDILIETSAYSVIKATASQSLAANTLATEFIALLSDAKAGHPNKNKIQECLFQIVENISFTPEQLEEIGVAFTVSGMFAIYTLEPSTD